MQYAVAVERQSSWSARYERHSFVWIKGATGFGVIDPLVEPICAVKLAPQFLGIFIPRSPIHFRATREPQCLVGHRIELVIERATELAQELVPELVIELASELFPERASELVIELVQKLAPELIPERATELAQELVPELDTELVPELAPELDPETAPELVPELAPELVPELASELDRSIQSMSCHQTCEWAVEDDHDRLFESSGVI